jgi:hypothetical protein
MCDRLPRHGARRRSPKGRPHQSRGVLSTSPAPSRTVGDDICAVALARGTGAGPRAEQLGRRQGVAACLHARLVLVRCPRADRRAKELLRRKLEYTRVSVKLALLRCTRRVTPRAVLLGVLRRRGRALCITCVQGARSAAARRRSRRFLTVHRRGRRVHLNDEAGVTRSKESVPLRNPWAGYFGAFF